METKMVMFKDPDGEILGGIMVDNKYIACGCCGGVFEVDEVTIIKVLTWINISDAILGDEAFPDTDI
jgi:hypothetical protein